MKTHKIFTTFAITVFGIFAFLVVGQTELTAQTKPRTRKKVVSKKTTTNTEVSKPKENTKPKESDYDLGIKFEVAQGSFLFTPYKIYSVVITNRDRRPVTIKKITANGEQELFVAVGLGSNLDEAKFPKVLTIGDKLRVVPDAEYKKELIIVDVETDLGVQSYKVKQ